MRRRTPTQSADPSKSTPRPVTSNAINLREIDWKPIPECLSQSTGFVLHWVSKLAEQIYTNAVATIGLRPYQVAILQMLEAEGAMVQARLSDRLHIDKATMVTLLNELEQQRLVERRPHPSDRRAFEIHLLEAGQQRVREAEQVSVVATKQFFSALSPIEQQTLHELLSRLATNYVSLSSEG
jgi:DNA-binding MarR family transcriptional regulator